MIGLGAETVIGSRQIRLSYSEARKIRQKEKLRRLKTRMSVLNLRPRRRSLSGATDGTKTKSSGRRTELDAPRLDGEVARS